MCKGLRPFGSIIQGFAVGSLLLVSSGCSNTSEPMLSPLAKPETSFYQQEVTDVFDCGDFQAVDSWLETFKSTVFFDSNGTSAQIQLQITIEGTITNSSTGASLPDRAHLTVFDNLEKGTSTIVGIAYNIKAPGVGAVYREVGKTVYDADNNIIFQAGPKQSLEGDIVGLCAALR